MATYTTVEAISALATIDAELDAFMKETPFPPRDFSDLPKLREARSAQEKETLAALGAPPPTVQESHQKVPLRDGFQAEYAIWRPKSPSASGSPMVVLMHGGGFCVGGPDQYSALARGICHVYGAVVVSLQYRLAPEYKFPYAPEDCWEGLQWAASNASSLGADLKSGFVLGGVSAGGNLTAVLAQKSLGGGLPSPLTGLWMSVPAVLNEVHFEKGLLDPKFKEVYFSLQQNSQAPILDEVAVKAFMDAYQPDWTSPLASPFEAEKPHVGLPKSYVQVCGMDPLRDDGLIYERILKENGVETRLDVYPGIPHAQWGFLPMLQTSKNINQDIMKGMGWLLGVEEKTAGSLNTPSAGG